MSCAVCGAVLTDVRCNHVCPEGNGYIPSLCLKCVGLFKHGKHTRLWSFRQKKMIEFSMIE